MCKKLYILLLSHVPQYTPGCSDGWDHGYLIRWFANAGLRTEGMCSSLSFYRCATQIRNYPFK